MPYQLLPKVTLILEPDIEKEVLLPKLFKIRTLKPESTTTVAHPPALNAEFTLYPYTCAKMESNTPI